MPVKSASSKTPFAFVELPKARSSRKPRRTGLTMMVDFGLPHGQVADIVAMAGAYIDLGKIAVGTARLYDLFYLRRKLALYRANRIRPFIGGQFMEYVFAIYGEGKAIGTLPTDGPVTLWPDLAGTRIALVGAHTVALYTLDGKLLWSDQIGNTTRALWLDDDLLAIVSAGGIATLDAKTGAIAATRCGWHFTRAAKPHPPGPRIERAALSW